MRNNVLVASLVTFMVLCSLGFFVADILVLLPVTGMAIVFVAVRCVYPHLKKAIIPALSGLSLLLYWAAAGWGLYFNGFGWNFGNRFMWLGLNWLIENPGPTYADFWGFWNILAMVLFLVAYPLSLWIGIQIGYVLFGRSEKQKGIIDFLFPNKKIP